MSCNIVGEYVDFSRKCIKKYLKVILEKYYDEDIYDDLINAYINTRYYNMYFEVNNRFEVNIVYYLKKSLEHFKDDAVYKKKARYMFHVFKFILYFDVVRECDSVRELIKEINEFRNKLELKDDNFESKFYGILKDDLNAKKEFIDSFDDKNFDINYVKVKDNVFDCVLNHNLKFSKLYSEYAINKVFNNKEIDEQKLFVTYPLVCIRVLQDIIKGNFKKIYFVPYSLSLMTKPKKKKRLLNIIDDDIVKEKMYLKVNFSDYLANKDEVYSLTKNGFKIAVKLDDSFVLNAENKELLRIFGYVITDELYDEIKDECNVIYIPN